MPPELGTKVRVWPMPGRKVQHGPRPVDAMGGGRFLDHETQEGHEVIWSEFHMEQWKCGDILLHSPKPAAAPIPTRRLPEKE